MAKRINSAWVNQRDGWIAQRSDAELNQLAAQVYRDSRTDENYGDRLETDDALQWLYSRGRKGREWGIVARAARRIGLSIDADGDR
jgi:hypothetical protein